jgi:hypothetical protein
MNVFQKFAVKLLGPSWKTSLAGYGQLFTVTVYQGYESLNGRALTQHDVITLLVSGGVAVALRFAKDEGVKVPDGIAQKAERNIVDDENQKVHVSQVGGHT